MPTIKPSLVNSTPLGKEPLTVSAGVPVLLLLIETLEPIVATTLLDPFHPAAVASEARFAFVWLLEIVNSN
jgi:hypothetical protein